MPFRLGPGRTKVQFVTATPMPSRIYRACVATGVASNTRYIQLAVCEALSRDLGIAMDEMVAELPPTRAEVGSRLGAQRRVGPANTYEDVIE